MVAASLPAHHGLADTIDRALSLVSQNEAVQADPSVPQNHQAAYPCDWLQRLAALPEQTIQANERLYWLTQLRQHFCVETYTLVQYQHMLTLAERIADWVMVIDIAYAIQHNPKVDITEAEWLSLIERQAEAYLRLGAVDRAKALLQTTLLRFYNNPMLWAFYDWLMEKEASVTGMDFTRPTPIEGKQAEYHAHALVLTPLEAHHLDAFRWVYSNQYAHQKSVAELCNLPRFEDDQQWFDWQYHNQIMPNHDVYAVIHQEWGFIGSVCLEVSNGVGFFYYWLGQDFQGYGFGPQAVGMLLSIGMEQNGMQSCYAKVYEDNLPSQKALHKLGFHPLPFRQMAPDDNEILYYLGPEQSEAVCRKELETLYADMGSHIALQHKVWLG